MKGLFTDVEMNSDNVKVGVPHFILLSFDLNVEKL